MRRADPFYSAKLPVRRALEHIESIHTRWLAYVSRDNIKPFAEYDPVTHQRVQKVRLVNELPGDIEEDAVRLIASLRGALDKAIHGAADILGSASIKHTNFPFGEHKTGFENQLASEKGPWRGIPVELHPLLLELEPYPKRNSSAEGNNLLAAFGELSNPAKHQNVLMVDLNFDGMGISYGAFRFDDMPFAWNELKNECELFRTPASHPSKGKIRIAAKLAFNDAGVLTRKEFIPVMFEVARMVEGIVLGVEAKTAEALERRQE